MPYFPGKSEKWDGWDDWDGFLYKTPPGENLANNGDGSLPGRVASPATLSLQMRKPPQSPRSLLFPGKYGMLSWGDCLAPGRFPGPRRPENRPSRLVAAPPRRRK